MQSLGKGEKCDDCGKKIARSETINVVIYEDEKPYGRICSKCLELLKEKCNS